MQYIHFLDIKMGTSNDIEKSQPWALILIAILGIIFTFYTLCDQNISNNRRIFGLIFIILWTLVWMYFLWVVWFYNKSYKTWVLALIAISGQLIFFILFIALNL